MKYTSTIAAVVMIASLAMGQTTHVDSLAHLNVRSGAGYSALWGYTAPDGREYALLGVNGSGSLPGGTSIIDITDLGNVHEVAFIQGPTSSWREMKTYRQYAYVVTEAGGGTQIIDLSGLPNSATLVRTFTYTSGANSTSRSHTVSIHDGYMYLNGCATWSPGGIVMFDLAGDPVYPQYVGTYEPEYIHDSYVLNDTIYGAAVYGGGGLHIADARTKSSVHEIGKIGYSGSGTHNSWVTKDRRFVITTDEIGSTPKTLKIWDIQNLPTIPSVPAATFTSSPADIEHNITIRGDYAYVAWYTAGLRVVDISNPASPADAGGFDTSTRTPGTYAGMWGVYPYFPSGKIIGSDMQNGLWVFSFSDLPARLPVSLLEPTDNDTVAVQSSITFRWTKTADLTRDPHYYEIRLVGSGLDTTWRADDSTTVMSDIGRFQPGEEYWWTVVTRDEWNTTASPDTFHFTFDVPTGIREGRDVPQQFSLSQNYPNPFNPSTVINYTLPAPEHVTLKVFNIIGQQVAELVNERKSAGRYSITFEGSSLVSGVYFYRLEAGTFVDTRKMLLVK